MCNELAGPISATLCPGNTAPFEEMSQRWRAVGNTVSDLTGPRFKQLILEMGYADDANSVFLPRSTFYTLFLSYRILNLTEDLHSIHFSSALSFFLHHETVSSFSTAFLYVHFPYLPNSHILDKSFPKKCFVNGYSLMLKYCSYCWCPKFLSISDTST